jgi:hypothetical protein
MNELKLLADKLMEHFKEAKDGDEYTRGYRGLNNNESK